MIVKKGNKWKAGLATALICNLFLIGTVMVFAPLEVFLGSFRDFHFDFGITWKIMTLAALAAVFAATVVEMLLPKRVALFLNALTVGTGICCYVQMMFLNGKMITLTGAGMLTTRAERIANLGIWAILMAVVTGGALLLLKKKKEALLHTVMRGISALLTVMQASALIILALTTDMSNFGGYMLSGEGRFEVARKNNTLVFVLDSSENAIFDDVLKEFPDTYDALSGFTYYRNATSVHSRTYPSLVYMMTGKVCHYDKPTYEYMREAFEEGPMLKELKAAGVDNRVFMWDVEKFSRDAKPYLSNMHITSFNSLDTVSASELFKGILNISLYKIAPYRLKYELEYSMDRINQKVTRHDQEPYQYFDYEYYHDLMDSELTVNENYPGAFRFYHLHGSHDNMYWDENMVRIDVTTKTQPLRGSLKIIEEFVKRLEAKGVLDETTIIVTADHGQFGKINASLDLKKTNKKPPNPIMLVKYADSDMSMPLVISNAPVSHEEIAATVIEGCGLDKSAYGRTFREIPEDEERKRAYYYTAFSEETDEEEYLHEYLIEGDANQFANWERTGNQWEIKYTIY